MRLPSIVTLFAAIVCAAACTSTPANATLDVQSFGARGDGRTLDTRAIQAAINSCAARGGGTVQFPAGRYLTATILLKSNVTLHLDAHATLLGATDSTRYRQLDAFKDGNGKPLGYALLGAIDAHNVGIDGEGTIDGQGAAVVLDASLLHPTHRPMLIRWVRCTGVTVRGVRLRAPAAWTMHVFQCNDVTIAGLNINSHAAINNDGIDVDSSRHVSISDCDIDSEDDSICFKTTSTRACQDVTVTNCRLSSNCAAIKAGSESVGDFENITVAHCTVVNADLGAIKLLSVDGAHLHDIHISDITIDNADVAIFLRLGARLNTFHAGDTPRRVGTLRDITLDNIHGTVLDPAIVISGIPGHTIKNISLSRIDLLLPGGGAADDALLAPPENINAFPDIDMFGDTLPAYGLYARHARGISINNMKITTDLPDLRPAILTTDVQGLQQTHQQTGAPLVPRP